MPIFAIIDGVKIEFYPIDHNPPHYHAVINEYKASIDIKTAKITQGNLPKSKANAIVEWTKKNQETLLEAWNDIRSGKIPTRID